MIFPRNVYKLLMSVISLVKNVIKIVKEKSRHTKNKWIETKNIRDANIANKKSIAMNTNK